MRAELMIGDWVLWMGKPCQFDLPLWQTEYGWTVDDSKNVEPIPLTEEILEKNGFNVENTTALLELRSGRVLINTIRLPEYGEADVKATGYNVERTYRMFVRIERTIKHVHELQQTMRLCGIEKEVVL